MRYQEHVTSSEAQFTCALLVRWQRVETSWASVQIMGKMGCLFLLLLCLPITAIGQSFIQSATVNQPTGSALTYSCSYSQANGGGNTLVLVGRFGVTVSSITDSQGNLWEPAGVNGSTGLWYATNSKAGTNSVTVTFPTNQPFQGVCAEYSGQLRLDQLAQGAGGTGTAAASSSISTIASGDLIIGFGNNYTTNTPSVTAGTGFTLRGQVNEFLEDMIQSAAGPVASSVTYGSSVSWNQYVVAFAVGPPKLGSLVQVGAVNQPGGSSLTYSCSFSGPNNSGNTLVLAGRFGATGTVTDSRGNAWTAVAGSGSTRLWYATNSKAGTNSVTVTYTANSSFQGVCAEYAGVMHVDQASPIASGTGTAAASASVSTTASGDLIIGYGTNDTSDGAVLTPGAGFSLRSLVNAFIEDETQATAGSIASSATYGSSVTWHQGVVAFSTGPPADTFIQSATVNQPTGSALTYSCSYSQANGGGNTLVLVGRFGVTVSSITDSQGNLWEPAGVNGSTGLWYATNSKAGTNSVTVTFPTNQPFQGVCAEYSGQLRLDQLAQGAGGTGTAAASSSISTIASGDLIIGFGNNYTTNTPSVTAGTGFTLRGQVNEFLEDMIQSAAGPVASSVTYGSSVSWNQYVVAFAVGPPKLGSLVQVGAVNQPGGSSLTYSCSFSGPNNSGNTLVLAGRFGATGTVTDSRGNAWTAVAGSGSTRLWYATNSKAGTNSVTVTYTANSSFQGVCAEYAGVMHVDQASPIASGTGTAAASASVSTTASGDLIIGYGTNDTSDGAVLTPGAGFSLRSLVNAFIEDETQATAGSIASSATYGSSVTWHQGVVAFSTGPPADTFIQSATVNQPTGSAALPV